MPQYVRLSQSRHDDVDAARVHGAAEVREQARHSNNWNELARLKPGATIEQAQTQVDTVNAAIVDKNPALKPLLINAGFHSNVSRLQDNLVREIKATLYLMWGGSLFVLLIGCVNVANLVLVRSRARLKELAMRLALGAGRWRLARQLVTESLLLTLLSAVAGLAVGAFALRALSTLSMQDLPRGSEITLDGVVVAWTLVMAAAIGIVLGLIPVATVLPLNLTTVLREEGRSGTAARGARTARRVLVVLQVAFAFVLLIGAGLLFASFRRVLAVDPGFNGDGVMTASIYLPPARHKDDAAVRAFTDEALRRMRGLPGVKAVGATDMIPFGGNNSDSVILAEGYQMRPGARRSPGHRHRGRADHPRRDAGRPEPAAATGAGGAVNGVVPAAGWRWERSAAAPWCSRAGPDAPRLRAAAPRHGPGGHHRRPDAGDLGAPSRRPGLARAQARRPGPAASRLYALIPILVASWALGGLYLSLGPSVAAGLFGLSNHLIGGLVVTLLCGTGAVTAFALRAGRPAGIAHRRHPAHGGTALTLGGLQGHAVALAAAGTVLAGIGFGDRRWPASARWPGWPRRRNAASSSPSPTSSPTWPSASRPCWPGSPAPTPGCTRPRWSMASAWSPSASPRWPPSACAPPGQHSQR